MKGDFQVANRLATELGLRNPIQVSNRYMREITEDSLMALTAFNHPSPTIFVRGTELVIESRKGH